uniref:Uncharacterized protein n=1 Tax=viral metagenome TaxID=1070528 RepID=A0A6M3LKB1_9ZZZZ
MTDRENALAWLAARDMSDEERSDMDRWKSSMRAAGLYHDEPRLGRREYRGGYIWRTYTHVYLMPRH